MCALAIRNDISPEELRRRARQEGDGRVAARLFAIGNALEGMDRASAARLAGMGRQTARVGHKGCLVAARPDPARTARCRFPIGLDYWGRVPGARHRRRAGDDAD